MAVSWIRPGSGVAEAPDSRTTRRRWARLAMLALLSATVAVAAEVGNGAWGASTDEGGATPVQTPDGVIDPEFLARLGGGVRSGSASMRRLGEALAADGDVLAIAAPTDGDDALAAGTVAVLRMRAAAAAPRTIVTLATIKARESGDHFGCALALRAMGTGAAGADNTGAAASALLAAGADRAAGLTGAVELFRVEYAPAADRRGAYAEAATPRAVHLTTLRAGTPQPGAEFGSAIAFGDAPGGGTAAESLGSRTILAVGAPRHDADTRFDAGSVDLYRPERPSRGSTEAWLACDTITAPAPQHSAWFGRAIALGGGILAIGCPGEDAHGGASSPGGRRTGDRTLEARHGDARESATETRANRHRNTAAPPRVDGAGAVHLYALDPDGHAHWFARLQSPSPEAHAWFGHALAIDGTSLLVGEPLGSVDHAGGRTRCGRGWRFHHPARDRPAEPHRPAVSSSHGADGARLQHGMGFGSMLAARGGIALVGAPGFDGAATDRGGPAVPVEDLGLAYAYRLGATAPDTLLAGPSPLPMSLFAHAAALIPHADGTGCTAAIGHLHVEEEAFAASPGVALFDLPRTVTPEAPPRPPDTTGRASASTARPSRSR